MRQRPGTCANRSAIRRLAVPLLLGIALWLALARVTLGQESDTLIIEVSLHPAGQAAVVLASSGTSSDSLVLPGSPLSSLLGIDLPPVVTLGELCQAVGPMVEVRWEPERLRLVIVDAYVTLPTTRRRLDELRAEARAQPDLTRGGRGLALAYTRDDLGADQLDVGYVWPRAAAFVSRSSEAPLAWSVSAAPLRQLWVSYRDEEGSDSPYNFDARLAIGRAFLGISYTEDGELGAQGAAALGPLVGFADPVNDRYVISLRGKVDAQLGRLGDRYSVRVSYGPSDPSAFTIPAIRRR